MRTYISLDDALRIAPLSTEDVALVFAAWTGFAWVFSFQSKKYLETGEFFDRMVGGYLIVANDGSSTGAPASVSWSKSVVAWAKQKGRESELEPWVLELAAM
jgi:hypothetical protein